MNYEQLKQIEQNIGLAQAKLGVLRAEVKMHQGMDTDKAGHIQTELEGIVKNIDDLQKIYLTIKKN